MLHKIKGEIMGLFGFGKKKKTEEVVEKVEEKVEEVVEECFI